MKDNKGFTLVELLAVIAIIAILGLIALEAIESVNKGNKEKAENINRNGILVSAVAYVPTSSVELPNSPTGSSGCTVYEYKKTGKTGSGSTICQVNLYLSYLVETGVLEEDLSNPKDKGKFDGNYFYELHEVYAEG